jgi:hypothetical protein
LRLVEAFMGRKEYIRIVIQDEALIYAGSTSPGPRLERIERLPARFPAGTIKPKEMPA